MEQSLSLFGAVNTMGEERSIAVGEYLVGRNTEAIFYSI